MENIKTLSNKDKKAIGQLLAFPKRSKKEENMAKIHAVSRKGNGKVMIKGEANILIALFASIGLSLAEKLAEEAGINQQKAECYILDFLKDGFVSLKKENGVSGDA